MCFRARKKPSKAGLTICTYEVTRGVHIHVCLRRAPCCEEGRRGVSECHLVVLTTPPQSIVSSVLSHRSPSSSDYSLLRLGMLCSNSHFCLSDLFSASLVCLCTLELSLPVQSTWERDGEGRHLKTLCRPPPQVSSAWIGGTTPPGLLLYGVFLALLRSTTAACSHSSIWLEPPHA